MTSDEREKTLAEDKGDYNSEIADILNDLNTHRDQRRTPTLNFTIQIRLKNMTSNEYTKTALLSHCAASGRSSDEVKILQQKLQYSKRCTSEMLLSLVQTLTNQRVYRKKIKAAS